MFSDSTPYTILIVEPNLDLQKPYAFLDQKLFKIIRVSNILTANNELQKQDFNLVLLSCSFSNKKILNFLESLKLASKSQIIPLLLVVDLNQPYSIVPGLNWDQKIAVLSSQSAEEELSTILHRLL